MSKDWFYWFTIRSLRLFFKIFFKYHVHGVEHLYKGGALLAANHISFLDPPLIAASWPEEIHFLARAGLFKNRFFAFLIRNLHAHPVHGSAEDISSFKLICQLLEEGDKVVVFPEGTRSENGQLQPFKLGVAMLALKTGCPIIPVYIQGTFEALPAHRKWPNFGTEVACLFGHPIFIDEYRHLDKKEAREAITKRLREEIEDLRIQHSLGNI